MFSAVPHSVWYSKWYNPWASPAGRVTSEVVVDDITDRIAFDIVTGVYAPGDRLPSVRAMAAQYDINPSTVQVVLARLRTLGFVESARGIGTVVRDVELYGGIDTWRYVFRFAQGLPERATKMFEGFLATRRMLILGVARNIEPAAPPPDLRPLRRAVDKLAMLVEAEAPLEDVARAELQAARIMMQALDQPVLLALYNSVGEILLEVPAVLEAMYTDPSVNLALFNQLIATWKEGNLTAEGIVRAETLLVRHHEACVARFRQALER